MSIVGEIRFFPFNYNPAGWLPCDGRTISSRTYPMLSAVLSSSWRDDGNGTLTLPDMRGGALVGIPADVPDWVPGIFFGSMGGTETSLLDLPTHRHTTQIGIADGSKMRAVPQPGDIPCRMVKSGTPPQPVAAFGDAANLVPMRADVIQPVGAAMPTYQAIQPFLALQACVCVQGEMPVRPTP